MGFILDCHDETHGFGAEVRRESFYVYGVAPEPDDSWHDERDGIEPPVFVYPDTYRGNGTGTVEFLLSDIPNLRKVLDAVEAHVNGT